jgi:hypothetical protein
MLANFVIHNAIGIKNMPVRQIESMYFCVSFLNKFATVFDGMGYIWVTGEVMNELLSHTMVKNKFVFDETFFHQNNEVLNYEDESQAML